MARLQACFLLVAIAASTHAFRAWPAPRAPWARRGTFAPGTGSLRGTTVDAPISHAVELGRPGVDLSHGSDSYDGFREFARSHFPFFTLRRGRDEYGGAGWVFMENAGGSQVPGCVVEGCKDALATRWRMELGKRHVARAREVCAALLNALDPASVVLGSSASALLRAVADATSRTLLPGDEVVVCEWSHEASIAPWLHAAASANATVKWWRLDSTTGEAPTDLSGLEALLSPRTRVVALSHVSNILGSVNDVAGATALARRLSPAASVAVDGVAFVPHMCPDVQAIGCDWYVFSCYKAFGPHLAALCGSPAALAALAPHGPNHAFVEPRSSGAARWELGTHNYEAAAGQAALGDYFRRLAAYGDQLGGSVHEAEGGEGGSLVGGGGAAGEGVHLPGAKTLPSAEAEAPDVPLSRATVEKAYGLMRAAERGPGARLLAFLDAKPAVTVLGARSWDNDTRLPTLSCVHNTLSAAEVAARLAARKIVSRHGNFLAPRLVSALRASPALGGGGAEGGGVASGKVNGEGSDGGSSGGGGKWCDPDAGVLRFSLVHYNSYADIDRLITALEDIGF